MTKRGFKLAIVGLVLALLMIFFTHPFIVWMDGQKAQPSLTEHKLYLLTYQVQLSAIEQDNLNGISATEKLHFDGGPALDILLAKRHNISAGFLGYYDALDAPPLETLKDSVVALACKNAWFDYLEKRLGQKQLTTLIAEADQMDIKYKRAELLAAFNTSESFASDSNYINLIPISELPFTYTLVFPIDGETERQIIYTDSAIFVTGSKLRRSTLKAYWDSEKSNYPWPDIPFATRVVEW
jgi:hypothetical protein